jgi:predicted HTH domain antitoxin
MLLMVTPQDLVDARLYASRDEVVADALRHLFRARPDLRISMAIYRYQREPIALAQAAAFAGVSWSQLREIMVERGVSLRLGPESLEEAHTEVDALRRVVP